LDVEDVKLVVPEVDEETCMQLMKNQDMEDSEYDASPWLHRFGGIHVLPGFGSYLSDTAVTSEGASASNTIVQFVDTRCLEFMQGRFYEITALVKLVDNDGNVYSCDPEVESCPFAGLVEPRGRVRISTGSGKPNKQGFTLLKGTVEITESLVHAEEPVSLFLRSDVDLTWFIDNVSMTLVETGTPLVTTSEDIPGDFLGVGGLVTSFAGDFLPPY
jgi:hypothetical protein